MGQTQSLEDHPLMQGAFAGNVEEIRRLISGGASPVQMISLKGYGEISPVIAAIHNNHVESVHLFLGNMTPSEISIRYGSKKLSALHLACINGSDEICDALLAKGADIRLPDADGNTALLSAISGKSLSIVWIIAEKAKSLGLEGYVDEANNKGQNGLHLACDSGNLAIVSCLLKEGADPNKLMKGIGRVGRTPIQVAALAGHADIVETLLTAGSRIHVDLEDRRGLTLLHQAVLNDHPKIVELLIGYGVHLETGHTQEMDPTPYLDHSADYPTPALLAAAFGRSSCLRAILNGPVGDVSLVLERPGRVDIVAVVIESLQANEVPESAESPMAWAIQFPCEYVYKSVKVLGVGGGVRYMTSCRKMTVSHVECAEMLLKAGAGMTSDQLTCLEENIEKLRKKGQGGDVLLRVREVLKSGMKHCLRCGMLGLWPSMDVEGGLFCSESCRSTHLRMNAPPAMVAVDAS